MGVARIEKNALVRLNGVDHRFLRKISDTTWQLEELRTGRIFDHTIDSLLIKIELGELVFANSGFVPRAQVMDLGASPEEQQAAKVRLLYVKGTMEVSSTRKKMEDAITAIWEKYKKPATRPGYVSVWCWKKRYIAAGNDLRALAGWHEKKGNREPRYPQEVIDLCKKAIESVFMCREKNSVKKTVDNAMIRVMDANHERPKSAELPFPTRRLVERMIQRIPAYDKTVAREGREAARKQYRSVKGHRITERPLQRAEMDHTQLDLFVIDERTLTPLGRPYLTVCIDDYTRCILGVAIGFTPPSYLSVAQCLKDCFLPKAGLRERYSEIQGAWLSYGVMDELVIDNGLEFHSVSLEKMCFSLGIELHYAPRKEPWFKGKIERFFGTVNTGFAHTIPGTSFSNIFKRGDYDPVKHACFTLADLNHYLRKWIVDEYHQTIHSTLGTTPAAMWKSSIRPEDIRHPDESVHLDVIIGTACERSLTHKGIEFEGLLYNSPELTELRRRKGPQLRVQVRVDESDIGSIYVLSPDATHPYRVPALATEYATRMSLWAHRVCKQNAREQSEGEVSIENLMETKKSLQRFSQEALTRKKGLAKRAKRFAEGAGDVISTAGGNRETSNRKEKTNAVLTLEASVPETICAESGDDEEFEFQPRLRERFKDEH
jgi:putative transposase